MSLHLCQLFEKLTMPLGHVSANFSELRLISEKFEDGIKSWRLTDVETLQSPVVYQTGVMEVAKGNIITQSQIITSKKREKT